MSYRIQQDPVKFLTDILNPAGVVRDLKSAWHLVSVDTLKNLFTKQNYEPAFQECSSEACSIIPSSGTPDNQCNQVILRISAVGAAGFAYKAAESLHDKLPVILPHLHDAHSALSAAAALVVPALWARGSLLALGIAGEAQHEIAGTNIRPDPAKSATNRVVTI